MQDAIDESHGLKFISKFNLVLFSLIGTIGIFMGLFYSFYFKIIKPENNLFIWNLISIIVGISSLIYLYWYTGQNEKK